MRCPERDDGDDATLSLALFSCIVDAVLFYSILKRIRFLYRDGLRRRALPTSVIEEGPNSPEVESGRNHHACPPPNPDGFRIVSCLPDLVKCSSSCAFTPRSIVLRALNPSQTPTKKTHTRTKSEGHHVQHAFSRTRPSCRS